MANRLYDIKNIFDIHEIEQILQTSTIFDKIEFSGITKELLRAILSEVRAQVTARTVLLDMGDEEVAECWFKNRLHVMLKHAVPPPPRDQRGCSMAVRERDARQGFLHFYENGQQNFSYTLADIEKWLDSE